MLRNNQGNILKVIHKTGCNLKQAEEALAKNNDWHSAFTYAENLMNK